MEPLKDKELDEMLAKWRVPPAPESLERKVCAPVRPSAWWRWLATGSIRVPVPVGLAIALLVGLLIVMAGARRVDSPAGNRTAHLSDFHPVKQLQPKIIRSNYETR